MIDSLSDKNKILVKERNTIKEVTQRAPALILFNTRIWAFFLFGTKNASVLHLHNKQPLSQY